MSRQLCQKPRQAPPGYRYWYGQQEFSPPQAPAWSHSSTKLFRTQMMGLSEHPAARKPYRMSSDRPAVSVHALVAAVVQESRPASGRGLAILGLTRDLGVCYIGNSRSRPCPEVCPLALCLPLHWSIQTGERSGDQGWGTLH
ncbi:hypothetical protein PoB_007663000 [Plakobranchus ocellatus]|uniref:Uncharacterized protein n=1 Tax=Plakobranchus ocellatus TaxID=259542 RepID=A0AAV4E138_9GAST|nr:hypothetical protein PoB_007663000 [Plakobranchus ocellatus]